MLVPFFLGALGFRWLEFPPSPPADLVAKGRLVYQNGAGPDRTLFDDKAVMGRWFDGRIRRPVDTVVLVSPDVVARWLGYLAEQEGWPDSELQARWTEARKRLDHTLTFVVRLAAFPKQDPLEFGVGSPPDYKNLDNVRFRLDFQRKIPTKDAIYTADGEKFVLGARPSQTVRFEKYEPSPVSNRPFYSLTDLAPLFLADGERDEPDDGIPLGDYYGAVFVVSFPVTRTMYRAKELELTVQLKSKRETAKFAMQSLPGPTFATQQEDTDQP